MKQLSKSSDGIILWARRSNPLNPVTDGFRYKEKTVIGVVKDFHLRSLTREIEPVFIGCDPDYPVPFNYMDVISVKINPDGAGRHPGFHEESLGAEEKDLHYMLPYTQLTYIATVNTSEGPE